MAAISEEKLRELKKSLSDLGIQQKDMAQHMGCAPMTIRNILNKHGYATLQQIETLVKYRDKKKAELEKKAQKIEAAI